MFLKDNFNVMDSNFYQVVSGGSYASFTQEYITPI